jgi:hypothetical protein
MRPPACPQARRGLRFVLAPAAAGDLGATPERGQSASLAVDVF